jgi:hypothetical protein
MAHQDKPGGRIWQATPLSDFEMPKSHKRTLAAPARSPIFHKSKSFSVWPEGSDGRFLAFRGVGG